MRSSLRTFSMESPTPGLTHNRSGVESAPTSQILQAISLPGSPENDASDTQLAFGATIRICMPKRVCSSRRVSLQTQVPQ
jgi:hypothetical protein